jgi:hypothetical protein
VISVSAAHGVGSITVLAFDPARLEAAPAEYSAAVLTRVLGMPVGSGDPADMLERAFADIEEYPAVSAEGDYASGILRSLPLGAVKAPPILLLSVFMMLYVFAVGPLDYFILKRRGWLKYSALSFVILAVAFSVTAWFVSFYLFAGSTRVNRVTFVDVVPASGDSARDLVTITDYCGFYAPRGARLPLEVEADTAAWSQIGTLEEYLHRGGGGLTADPLEVDSLYPARNRATLSIPFRSLRAARVLAMRREIFPLTVRVDPRERTVLATNDLPCRLRDAVLVTPGGTMVIGDLGPGEQRRCPLAPAVVSAPLPDARRLTTDPAVEDHAALDELGPFFFSLGRYQAQDPVPTGLERTLWKNGFARPHLVPRGRSMLVAWTGARDPFRLPGGGEPGFRVTVIRRILEP